MPSPIGHALAGFAAGWLIAGTGPSDPARFDGGSRKSLRRRSAWVRAAGFAAAGLAADLNLLIGRHSQFTHSAGAVAIVLVAAIVAWRGRPAWLRTAVAIAAAYASHAALDWLAQDATPPRGITALWPFSSSYFLSHADVFQGISREPWRPGFLAHNALAVLREVVLIGPIALAAWWVRRKRLGRQILPPASAGDGRKLQSPKRLRVEGESLNRR